MSKNIFDDEVFVNKYVNGEVPFDKVSELEHVKIIHYIQKLERENEELKAENSNKKGKIGVLEHSIKNIGLLLDFAKISQTK